MDRFLELLHHHRVRPSSASEPHRPASTSPHFNRNNFDRTLADNGIMYIFASALLGSRPDLLALYTTNRRADYKAMTSAFMEGIDLVETECRKSTIALMSSEKALEACHRTLLVCHHLHNLGHDVRHLLTDRADPESHPTLLKRLMQQHRLDNADQAVDAQSAQAAY